MTDGGSTARNTMPLRRETYRPSSVIRHPSSRPSTRDELRPVGLDALGGEERLEGLEAFRRVADGSGGLARGEAVGGERSGGLADRPLDGVQSVAAVRHMSHAEVLAGGEE